jgi:L-lactate dehydrogenase complex protein LldF
MTSPEFNSRIHASISDLNLQAALDGNAERRKKGRIAAFASLSDYQERRQQAHQVRSNVITHLDEYLAQFSESVTSNGISLHRAADANEAVRIFLDIARRHDAHLVAKSKSMVSEEVDLNRALEAAGLRPVETDLGEYIVQLRGERPSHIITPAVHLRRSEVGELFQQKLGIPYTEDISTLTETARQVLRHIFLTADIGFSGVNFGVAETGTLCIVTNEGNGRMVTTVPPVHIALMGIERLVPTLDDLALMLSLLPRSATGQKLSVYTQLLHSPRRLNDPDGPRERHLILLDNGRKRLRNSPLSEILYCIRCGACLNACPVFREIGGHAYVGTDGRPAPYPGPIGSVVSPGLFGLEQFGHLARASTLCGACKEVCSVDIDLPRLLLRVRAGQGPSDQPHKTRPPFTLTFGLKIFRLFGTNTLLFTLVQRLACLTSHLLSPRSYWMHLPAFTGWGYSKDFPRPALKPFHSSFIHREAQDSEKPAQITKNHSDKPHPMAEVGSLVTQFSAEVKALGGQVVEVKSRNLHARLASLLSERGIKKIQVDETGALHTASLQEAGVSIIHEPDHTVRCGVTAALVGIADTGTILVTSGNNLPLTASLLPETHIAILKASAILPSLPEALRLPEVRQASAAVLITGPSRTADIEMTLTIGVHGPKELIVLLVDDI